jgi:hypothetical protein
VWHKDRARQQVLERANWTFERIRGSAFYLDPDAALLPLWQRLADLGIPVGVWPPAQTSRPIFREVSGMGRRSDLARDPDETAANTGSGAAALGASRSLSVILDPTSTGPERESPSVGAGSSAPRAESAVAPSAVEADEPPRGNQGSGDQGSGDAIRPEHAVSATSIPSGARASSTLPPYHEWKSHVLPHPDTAPLSEIVSGLLDIVAAEGPIHAQRAYRVYTLAAGGLRVGTEMRRSFHAATGLALRTGALRQLDDELVQQDEKTLYIPGKPSVLVRELGPRQLSDVPRSEVAKLIKYLRVEGTADDVVKRAVLQAYGLIRLTARTSQYLDECLSYQWRRPTTT